MNSKKDQHLELKVMEGPQAGASMLLNASSNYRVGSDPGDNHDVLLRAVDSDFCLSLDTTPGSESVCAEYGDISIGSRKMKIGQSVPIVSGDQISVANISFDLLQRGEAPADVTEKPNSGLSMFLGGLLLTGGSALAIFGTSNSPEAEVAVAPPLEELLYEASLPALEIVEQEDEPVRIVGMLNDKSEQDKLQEIVADRPEVIHLHTKTEKQLTDDVTEFYRINNVAADVSRNSDSSIVVVTQESDLDHLDVIEEKVKTEIAFVENVVRENKPAVTVKKKKAKKDPANQVLMVIAGETPYVLTNGGGRYFVGSVLPSGEIIERIDNESVVLKKGEDEFLMTF